MKNVLLAGTVLVLTGLALVVSGSDFNGDGRDDIAIFRPSSGLWAIRGVTRAYTSVVRETTRLPETITAPEPMT